MLVILSLIGGLVLIIAVIVMLVKLFFIFKKPKDIIAKNKAAGASLLVKKYPEANPQIYRTTFTLIGFIFGTGLAIAAFSWTVYDRTTSFGGDIFVPEDFEIEPAQTRIVPPPPPPPPPPEIKVIDNDDDINDDDIDIFNIEVEPQDTIIQIPTYEESLPDEDEIHAVVQDMPEFPGGEEALMRYLASIQYPPIARENDIEGLVFIRFVVDRDGSVSNLEILRGSDRLLNDAALRHVQNMPKWTPGRQRGQAVRVYYTVPLRFTLD